MTDIEERINDEGFAMNRSVDNSEGYKILYQMGMPPTVQGNGMGVGEYNSSNFYSKMMNNEKIKEEGEQEEDKKKEDEMVDDKKYELINGDKDLIGYISNEIYYPIDKDKKEIKKDKNLSNEKNLMDTPIGEILENTSTMLNEFDSNFLKALHKIDMEHGYSSNEKRYMINMKRYTLAFMKYLQEDNNIFYMGIALFIISIILYFINIIRTNDKPA
jgi:hypothetical protein